ncbi:hypothetical protein K8I28_16505 [bacterium]|nr:hypothetical protein [bacterium]
MIRYQFRFKKSLPFDEIDGNLEVAMFAAQCIHGRTQLLLDAKFDANPMNNTCWIDADTDVGKTILQIFTGTMALLFGERSFKVRKIVSDPIRTDKSKTNQGVAA